MALNFPEPIWVSCEIVQIGHSRGHYYLELVDKSEESDSVSARSQGILWQRTQRQLQKTHGNNLQHLLKEGMEVMIQVQIDFHEKYGLKLIIEDIDPTYTLGKLAIKRQQIIDTLLKQNLLYKNKSVLLPTVLQSIAVISTENAAGYQDFKQQLTKNEYGYTYDLHFFTASMQGKMVEKEVVLNLKKITKRKTKYDAIVIIRGGGAKLDLAAFDNLGIGTAVAQCPIPVLVGIGHEIDETILDLVAHKSLKTPTAVADYLLYHNLQFESSIMELGQTIKEMVQYHTAHRKLELEAMTQNISYRITNLLNNQKRILEYIEVDLPKNINHRIKQEFQQLSHFENLAIFLSPEATLKRGFSLTLLDGKVIKQSKDLPNGTEILTKFADDQVKSVIIKSDLLDDK